MKKFITTAIILLMWISAFAKSHKDFCVQVGTPQKQISKALGKPNIVTKDDEDRLTWIYLDVKKVPELNVTKSERTKKSDENTILTVKFDDNENVYSYSYMTKYIGEKND